MSKQIQVTTRTFRCPRRLSQEIDVVADKTDRHASQVIRDAVRRYLDGDQSSYGSSPGDSAQ